MTFSRKDALLGKNRQETLFLQTWGQIEGNPNQYLKRKLQALFEDNSDQSKCNGTACGAHGWEMKCFVVMVSAWGKGKGFEFIQGSH